MDYPGPELWQDRQTWFEAELMRRSEVGSFLVGEQASALSMDVERAFCAGAWASVIVMSVTVIEAQIREAEVPGGNQNLARMVDVLGLDPGVQALRKRRNALVHANADQPALTVDQQWGNREVLEKEARTAVILMMDMLFRNPGI